MRIVEEMSSASTVGEPSAIARTIVFGVLISAGVLLLKVWWARPEIAITLLLTLLLASASGVVLVRLLAAEKQRRLATLWQSLVLSALGLLLVQLGRNDWLMVFAGIAITGIGLGSASQVTKALLRPLASISVGAGAAMLAVIGAIVSVTLLIPSQASPDFAIAWLIDLVLLAALVARIAEQDEPSPQPSPTGRGSC